MRYKLIIIFIFILLNNNIFSQESLNIRYYYKLGIEDFANNRFISAESNFFKVLEFTNTRDKSSPLIPRAYYFLGDIYFIQQSYDKAINNYRFISRFYPESDIYSKSLYKLGRTLIIANRYNEGIPILYEYISKYSNTDSLEDSALYWLARGQIVLGNYDTAYKLYLTILEKYPETTLSYDIRNSISKISNILELELKRKEYYSKVDEKLQKIKQKNESLMREKKLLETMSKLLSIKQRFLDIKNEKVAILEYIKKNK